jgi:hypothetical protein
MTYEPTTTVQTIGVATPTQDAIFCAYEPKNAIRHDAEKRRRTPSVATPIVATPRFHICIAHAPRLPYDTLSKRRWASRHLPSQHRLQFQIKPTRASRRHTTRYSQKTPSIETPTKYSVYSVHELSEDTRQDARKSTPSVATPITATPTQDSIHRVHEPRRATRRWASQQLLSQSRHKIHYLQGKNKKRRQQSDTEGCDGYRRDADSRYHRQRTWTCEVTRHNAEKPTPSTVTPFVAMPTQETKPKPTKASESDVVWCWQTDEQRRDAETRHHI